LEKIPDWKARSPYLAMLGDIGNIKKTTYEKIIKREAQKYKTVFIVAGNRILSPFCFDVLFLNRNFFVFVLFLTHTLTFINDQQSSFVFLF
jgi:hypothetical protein